MADTSPSTGPPTAPGSASASSVGARRQRTSPRWCVKHALYWAFVIGLLAALRFDNGDPNTAAPPNEDPTGLVVFAAAFVGAALWLLRRTLRRIDHVHAVRSLSSGLVLFVVLVGGLTAFLSLAQTHGVRIESCRTPAGTDTCSSAASHMEVLGLLAWNAADVAPALEIPRSLEWTRPARSSNAVVGASVLGVRLWVVIGILGLVRRLWTRFAARELGERNSDGR